VPALSKWSGTGPRRHGDGGTEPLPLQRG